MGKQIYLKKLNDLFNRSPVIDFKSVERLVKENKSSYSKLLILTLLKNKKIKKLTKGFYTKHDEITLSVFCFKPAYLGLQSALSFHELWDQASVPIVITTKKVRRGRREVMNANIFVRNLSKKYFFGFDYYKDGDFYIPYSNIEKTFIDLIFYNQTIDKDVLKKIKEKINKKKLKSYLKFYPKKTINKVRKIFLQK